MHKRAGPNRMAVPQKMTEREVKAMKNASALSKRLSGLNASIRRATVAAMEESIAQMVRDAKALSPEEPFELRDSIRGEVSAQGNLTEGKIWAAPCAIDVEHGRGEYGSPQPFLNPAYQIGKQTLIRRIRQGIGAGR